MARLFTNDPDIARVSIPILKFEDAGDGAVYVYGKATDATLDRDEQIIDPVFAAKSLARWFETGANVRVMHSPALYPAGKGVELVSGDDGQYLKSRIVEPTAIKLVKEGVLTAYSVGISQPQILRDNVAKRGRVVGGETVEVSLVDRPANPSCGIVLAKMAGNEVELTEQDFVQETDDDTSITVGSQKFTPSDFADLLVKLGKVEKSKLSAKERDNISSGDFAYIDSDGNRHLPIEDEGHIRAAMSRFDQTHFESSSARKAAAKKIVSRAKSHGIEVSDDSAVAQAAKVAETDLDKAKSMSKKNCSECGKHYNADTDKTHCDSCGHKLPAASDMKTVEPDLEKALSVEDGIPYALKQIHDATCAAYSWIDVKAAYPDLEKNGLAAALGPSATNLLYRMLEHEIGEDAGTGREARDIGHLAKAYELLSMFLADEAMEMHVMAEARADLHKSFMAANPLAPEHITPLGPGQNPNPHRFNRPYISGGHANDTAKAGQHPHIPASSHVPYGDDFQRGLITSGHAADSPENSGGKGRTPEQSHAMTTPSKAPGEGSKGVEADMTKTSSVRARAQAALMQVHDSVAYAYPDHCIMVPHTTDVAYQPLAETEGDLDTRAKNVPTPYKSAEPDLVKMLDTDVVKTALAELIEAKFATERADYEEKIEKQNTSLEELQRKYEELAAQPDPAQAPVRGMTGLEQLLGKRSQDTRDEVTEREHRIAQYARWLDSPDPAQREAARSLLTKMAR